MTRKHFYRFNNSHPRTEFSEQMTSHPAVFLWKCAKPWTSVLTSQHSHRLDGRKIWLFFAFLYVNCWRLCLLTHYQVQLSEKDWTAWGWVLHSLLFLETSIQPTQMLFTIVQWRVNPHLLSSSCSCCIKQNFPFPIPPLTFLLSYPNHMDAARMDG